MGMRRIAIIIVLVLLTGCAPKAAVYQESAVPEILSPVEASESFVVMAVSQGVTLSFKESTCEIRVTDQDGVVWASTPENYEDDPLAKGQNKMTLSSLITATFLSKMGNEDTETAMAGSIRRGNYTAWHIPNGLRIAFYFPAKRTIIPVDITLEDGTLLVSVFPDQIEEVEAPEDESEDAAELANRLYKITNIQIMPYFLSASSDENGYLFVPDGSGALIYLNNGKSKSTYSQNIYGNDRNTPPVQRLGGVKDALMPVYGIYRDGSGVLAVIENGAPLAQVQAAVSGDKTSYNAVSAGFTLRPPGSYSVTGIDGKARIIKVTSEWITGVSAVSIRYHFLGLGGDYSKMAAVYREYLQSQGYTPQTSEPAAPLVLDLYGSVTGEKSVMGLPMKIRTPLTSFNDAEMLADALLAGGVDALFVRYNNWLKGGSRNTAPTAFAPDGKLGGAKAFTQMAAAFQAKGVALYPDIDLTTAYQKPFMGMGRPVIRNVSNMPVEQYAFDLSVSTKTEALQSRYWLFSPVLFPVYINRFLDHHLSVQSNDLFSGYSLGAIANAPYSDVGTAKIDRGLTELLIRQAAESVRDKAGGLSLSAPGSFLFPLVDLVLDTPESSSGFILEDVSIPFYQMVLSGFVDYSLPAFNLAADTRMQILKAAETGAYLQLSVINENTALLKDTPLEYLYSAAYDAWEQPALQALAELSPVYAAASGSIVHHEWLTDGVARSVYENGAVVLVNYSNEPYLSPDGVTVSAKGFVLTNTSEQEEQ